MDQAQEPLDITASPIVTQSAEPLSVKLMGWFVCVDETIWYSALPRVRRRSRSRMDVNPEPAVNWSVAPRRREPDDHVVGVGRRDVA